MKMIKTIKANDDNAKITVTVSIDTASHLTREELSHLAESLASSIMRDIPGAPFISTPLSKIKVS